MLITSIFVAYIIPTLFVLFCASKLKSKACVWQAFVPVWNLYLVVLWGYIVLETIFAELWRKS